METMQDGKTYIYGLGGYDGTNPTGAGVQDLATAISTLSSALDGKVSKSGDTMKGVLHINYDLLSVEGGALGTAQWHVRWWSATDQWVFEINPEDTSKPQYVIAIPTTGGTLALTSDIPTSMAWGSITGKPTTLSGYGITDALKSDFASLTNNAAFTSAVAAVSPPTDLTHVEAEIETNRTAIATLSARAYIEVVSADEVYYVFTTNQE